MTLSSVLQAVGSARDSTTDGRVHQEREDIRREPNEVLNLLGHPFPRSVRTVGKKSRSLSKRRCPNPTDYAKASECWLSVVGVTHFCLCLSHVK